MAKKTLGHVELEWTCPACGTRNPGSSRTCKGCGLPMPEDMAFEVGAGQPPIDTRAETAARVAVGPDIHCPYCGARNPGDATVCVQCGGDLSEGARRAAGAVLGAYESGPPPDVICPNCGATNPGTATVCTQCGAPLPRASAAPPAEAVPAAGKRRTLSLPVLLLIGLLACAGVWILIGALSRSTATVGTVAAVEWTYAIEMEQLGPVEHEDWRDQVPSGARLGDCSSKVRRTVDEPVPGATEVCGTPYVEDTGTGQGRVVQDCQYQVADEWCRYTVQAWVSAGEEEASGGDMNPFWPAVATSAGRRERGRTETYRVVFDADGSQPVYRPGSLDEFRRFAPGSRWEIEVNRMGGVVAAKPAP
jgi:ribosomal protein L40E